jgi:hypothetical protein
MPIQTEFWRDKIVNAIFEANPHLDKCMDVSSQVIGGVAVHIPNSGGSAGVVRNPTYPLQIVTRTDIDVLYLLDKYSTKAIYVPDLEQAELSYPKMQSIMMENMGDLVQFTGRDLIYKWTQNLTNSEVVLTTGTGVASTLAGTTGTRKRLLGADILAAGAILDNQNIPDDGERYLMLSPDHYNMLINDATLQWAFAGIVNLAKGELPSLYGFKLMKKPTVIRRSLAGAVKVPEAATATDDNLAGLFWHPSCVEAAKGDFGVYYNAGRAEYQGDLVSFNTRLGGRHIRNDRKGVGMIVAAA